MQSRTQLFEFFGVFAGVYSSARFANACPNSWLRTVKGWLMFILITFS